MSRVDPKLFIFGGSIRLIYSTGLFGLACLTGLFDWLMSHLRDRYNCAVNK